MRNKVSSIILIIPYFGKWPFWMPLFVKSCQFNPDVNWLLIGDCGRPERMPENMTYQFISFEDYCNRVSQTLGLDFHPDQPYKLCDLKPALGYVHEEEIRGYDFWGFGDLDLVYGDLKGYFTEEKLARYDFIATHERRVSGHLCIMRNNEKYRNLFWKIPTFRERIQDKAHHALDEGGFSRLFLKRKNFPRPLFRMAGMLNPLRRSAEFKEAFSTPNGKVPWVDGSYNFPEVWIWDHGKLTNSRMLGREFPYFHFLSWKSEFKKDPDTTGGAYIMKLAEAGRWKMSKEGFQLI